MVEDYFICFTQTQTETQTRIKQADEYCYESLLCNTALVAVVWLFEIMRVS